MAASCVGAQEINSQLLNSGSIFNMKSPAKPGRGSASTSDIPLAINTKGSLIELAHKLKWAYKNFCPKDDKGDDEEDSLCISDPWQNGMKQRPPLDPDRYVIQSIHCDSRPHPLLAYGDSLFQNTIPGQQYSYTSLGTVHNYNGSAYSSTNGYLPFSSALAMNQMLQRRTDETDNVDESKVNSVEVERPKESNTEKSPDSRDESIQKFLTDYGEILTMKPSKNGVVGPSLWNLLTATKEIRELDHTKLIRSFKIGKPANEVLLEKMASRLLDEDDAHHEKDEKVDVVQNGTCDDAEVTSDELELECPKLQPTNPLDIRDRLITPLSEFEVSAICSSAVDFVVKHKTPARVLNQLAVMQLQHGKDLYPDHLFTQRFEQLHSSDGLRRYKCPKCMYQTDNKSHLRRHVSSVHFIGMPYYCYICHKEFPRSEKVKAHFMKFHPDVEYNHRLVRKDNYFGVGYCPETLKNGQETTPRRSPSIKLTPTNMRTSSMSSDRSIVNSTPLSLNSHPTHNLLAQALGAVASNGSHNEGREHKPVWKSPVKSEAGEKRYYCPQCPYTGKDIWHLKRHVNDVHQQLKDLKCPMCDYSTGRKHRLVTHMKNHGQLFCFHCDFSTENLVIFQAHVKVCSLASRRAQHKCPRCDRACTNRKQLQYHQFREHGIIMFCCSKCMFYSENNQEYKEHLQQHKDQHLDYICQVCNEVLPDYRSLRSHLTSHKQSPPSAASTTTPEKGNRSTEKKTQDKLKCPSCPFECSYYHIMKEHRLVHTDNFLKCDVSDCSFTTVWPQIMEHHKKNQHGTSNGGNVDKSSLELSPKGKGTFICPVCQNNRPPFKYKRSFDKHMAQHKEDEEKCPLCPQVFYFRASLKQHLKQDHQARVIEVSSSDEESSEDLTESDSDKEHQREQQSHSLSQAHLGSPGNQTSVQESSQFIQL
ncbi:hypothetical protein LSH36_733g01023 [Paralvinella palmiformis]|uniref:C2H2-type domain-containing protein n=1 Tax=Paralvinella palmiformis TaxID=53620 RepID=A0AAD9J1C3_9ANNE|nr:hypothetical protein LSH36_733g01023 [Paralvinella palmiformis]